MTDESFDADQFMTDDYPLDEPTDESEPFSDHDCLKCGDVCDCGEDIDACTGCSYCNDEDDESDE